MHVCFNGYMREFKIGQQLQMRCKKLNVEQDEIAGKVGCDKATITRDFKGQNTPIGRIELVVNELYEKVRDREHMKKEWMREIDELFNQHKSAKRLRKALNSVKRRCICRILLPTSFKLDFVDGVQRIKSASFMLSAKRSRSSRACFYSDVPCVAIYDKAVRNEVYTFRIVPKLGLCYVTGHSTGRLREVVGEEAIVPFRSFAKAKGFGTDGMLGLLQLAKECIMTDENLNVNAYKQGNKLSIWESDLKRWLKSINKLMNHKKRKQLDEAVSDLRDSQAEMFAALQNAKSAASLKENLIAEINKIQNQLYSNIQPN